MNTVLKKNVTVIEQNNSGADFPSRPDYYAKAKASQRSVKSSLSRVKSIGNIASKKLLPMNDGLHGFNSKKLSS